MINAQAESAIDWIGLSSACQRAARDFYDSGNQELAANAYRWARFYLFRALGDNAGDSMTKAFRSYGYSVSEHPNF